MYTLRPHPIINSARDDHLHGKSPCLSYLVSYRSFQLSASFHKITDVFGGGFQDNLVAPCFEVLDVFRGFRGFIHPQLRATEGIKEHFSVPSVVC